MMRSGRLMVGPPTHTKRMRKGDCFGFLVPGTKLTSSSVSTRYLGGTASPSGRCGVRSRSRPSDQALRVLAASGKRYQLRIPHFDQKVPFQCVPEGFMENGYQVGFPRFPQPSDLLLRIRVEKFEDEGWDASWRSVPRIDWLFLADRSVDRTTG